MTRNTLRSCSFFLLLTAITLATPGRTQSWNAPVQVPDHRGSGGSIGTFNSMAIVDGKPAIATVDVTHNGVWYIRANDAAGTDWNAPMMVRTPSIDGNHLSLAVIDGLPAIAYYNGDLMFVRANDVNGTSWSEPVVVDANGNAGKFASLETVNGTPAIAYRDDTNNRVRYVRALDAQGTTWGAPVFPELLQGGGQYCSLKVVNGHPAIAHGLACCARYVRAADANGDTWNAGIGFSTGVNAGMFTSLTVVNGVPCVAFHDNDNGDVVFRRALDANGESWAGSVIAQHIASVDVGSYCRLMEVDGHPAIAYQHDTDQDLMYVRATNANGTAWSGHTVLDASGVVGREVAAIVVDGAPAVAYQDVTNGDLKFIRASNSTGSSPWNTPIVFDTYPAIGEYTSQVIVDGFPALAYYDADNKDLRYIRALDSTGTQWGTSITVDSLTNCGAYCSMALVNGRPAIAYFDETHNVRYVRAGDALGANWGTPVNLDNQSGPRGQGIALAVIAGRPAVAYQNNTNANIRYLRASDVDGTAWPLNGVTVGTSGSLNIQISMVELTGLPALSYFRGGQNDLIFTRGGSVDYSGPGIIELIVDGTGTVGRHVDLAVVNGVAAVCYLDETNNDLKFCRATNAAGIPWASPVVVSTNGGKFNSMAVVNGRPAIAFQDGTNNTLRYVRAADANGDAWTTPLTLSTMASIHASMVVNGSQVGIAFHSTRYAQPYFVGGSVCTADNAVSLNGNTLTADTEGAQYQWLDCNNGSLPIPNETVRSFTGNTGNYAVVVTDGACVDTSACVQILITEVRDEVGASVQVFPNPTTGTITIRGMMATGTTHLTLFDATGRSVLEQSRTATDAIDLDLSHIRSGAYLLRIRDSEGATSVQRIAVE